MILSADPVRIAGSGLKNSKPCGQIACETARPRAAVPRKSGGFPDLEARFEGLGQRGRRRRVVSRHQWRQPVDRRRADLFDMLPDGGQRRRHEATEGMIVMPGDPQPLAPTDEAVAIGRPKCADGQPVVGA